MLEEITCYCPWKKCMEWPIRCRNADDFAQFHLNHHEGTYWSSQDKSCVLLCWTQLKSLRLQIHRLILWSSLHNKRLFIGCVFMCQSNQFRPGKSKAFDCEPCTRDGKGVVGDLNSDLLRLKTCPRKGEFKVRAFWTEIWTNPNFKSSNARGRRWLRTDRHILRNLTNYSP